MKISTEEDLRDLIFESLVEPIAELGCIGPPKCKQPDCKGGQHSTGLGMFEGVIEVEIDDDVFEINISKQNNGPIA